MADNLRDVTIIARGGLYTNEDPLTLAGTEPGSAIRMTNFEISQFGGYQYGLTVMNIMMLIILRFLVLVKSLVSGFTMTRSMPQDVTQLILLRQRYL
jgi:hypothetical protein